MRAALDAPGGRSHPPPPHGLAGRRPFDHAALLRAYRAWLGRPLAVIHFDAHCDTWTDHFGEPSGHGTWVYEAMQEGLVLPACFTQIGIRSAGERAARDYVADARRPDLHRACLRGLESPTQLAPVLHRHAPAAWRSTATHPST
jgi:hypothetical protein